MLAPRKLPRKKFVEDLNDCDLRIEELIIKGQVKNIERLSRLSKLQKLELYTVSQRLLYEYAPYLQGIPQLRFHEVRCTDLSVLGTLPDLESLEVEWNTKITELWNMSQNHKLTKLVLMDIPKLNDITNIQTASRLKELAITRRVFGKLKIKSLEPIASLKHLEFLELSHLQVDSKSQLRPLAKLKNLKHLSISKQFETEEYAYLSVMLPNTRSESFHAYYKTDRAWFGDKDVMVIGKRKPFLNSKKDIDKLEKYSNDFEKLRRKYM